MSYLLDTNALVAVLRAPGSPVERRMRQCRPGEVATSAIVMHELYYGAHRSRRVEHNLSQAEQVGLPVLELTREDARSAGLIRALLAGEGRPIGPYDVLIAAQALARGLILVTANTRELARVDGLEVDDWSKA